MHYRLQCITKVKRYCSDECFLAAWEKDHEVECKELRDAVLRDSVFHQSQYELMYKKEEAKVLAGERRHQARRLQVKALKGRVTCLEEKLTAVRKENRKLKVEKAGFKSAFARQKARKTGVAAKKTKVATTGQQTELSFGKDEVKLMAMTSVTKVEYKSLDLMEAKESQMRSPQRGHQGHNPLFLKLTGSRQPERVELLQLKSVQLRANQVMDIIRFVSIIKTRMCLHILQRFIRINPPG